MHPLHRYIFECFNGKIGNGKSNLMVLHSCDNKMCINPKHLRLGTSKENFADAKINGKLPLGEARPNAKLNNKKVKAIRLWYKNGVSQNRISRIFKVSRHLVQRVIKREVWNHVL